MNVIQKINIDKELTSNNQIIVRDETGLYSASNTGGYGGVNGLPTNKFMKYVFDLHNLYTNNKYRQIQSDIIQNTNEQHYPPIENIVNKENVIIDADNVDLLYFEDGLYELGMTVIYDDLHSGQGFADTDVVVNVAGAEALYNRYNAIYINGDIYLLQGFVNSNLILNKPVTTTFNSFSVAMYSDTNLIISDSLNDAINNIIANISNDCGCDGNTKVVNVMSEVQLYYWGMQRSIQTNDINQAYEYFKMAKLLSCSLNNK